MVARKQSAFGVVSMYWFKVSFLQGPEGLGKLMMLSAKEEKGKTFEKIGIHLIRKKTQLS